MAPRTSAGVPTPASAKRRPLLTRLAVLRQRRSWTRRASSWGHHGSADLGPVVEEVLKQATCPAGGDALDIGCGTGVVALELAQRGIRVLAADVSSAMTDALQAEAVSRGLDNVTTLVGPAEELDLAPGSLDIVVSNYALHHLRDSDKERLLRSAAVWLRPGGRLVVGDMMFGRGATARDRQIIASKLFALLRKGPGGVWRIVKNAARFSLRLQERPLRPDAWVALFGHAGFVDVTVLPVVAEAAVVVGVRPVVA
ncbi:MAG: class I SAM-dependent methyltransferase [Acidimicrobiales bacterium]